MALQGPRSKHSFVAQAPLDGDVGLLELSSSIFPSPNHPVTCASVLSRPATASSANGTRAHQPSCFPSVNLNVRANLPNYLFFYTDVRFSLHAYQIHERGHKIRQASCARRERVLTRESLHHYAGGTASPDVLLSSSSWCGFGQVEQAAVSASILACFRSYQQECVGERKFAYATERLRDDNKP